MKVFDIKLKHNDVFSVYFRNGIVTLVTDELFPYPPSPNKWDRETNTFSGHGPPHYDKLIFPAYRVLKKDIDAFLEIHIPKLIKYYIDTYTWSDKLNMFILTKDFDDFFKIGFGIREGEYSTIHEYGQKIVDSYMKLKMFW